MNRLTNALTNHRMGLRIIKTGIAVTVCVAVSFLLKLNQPFFAVIATVMSMGKSIDISFKSGKNKLIGVIIGIAIGSGFALIAPANAGLCGIGIILTLYLCHLFKLTGASTLSCFLFAAMMFIRDFGAHIITWHFAATCMIDSIIGIAIALLVNLIVMPPNYADEIKKSFTVLREQIKESVGNAADRKQIDARAAEAAMQKVNYNVNLYIAEAKFLRWNDEDVFKVSCKISTYQMILDELRAVKVMELTEDGAEPAPEVFTAYRYHMDRMQKLFESTTEEPGPEAQ